MYATLMNSIDCVKKRIELIVSRSHVPEDPLHSKNTLEWLLKLAPDADDALRVSALGHDIERAMEGRKVKREAFRDFDEFKSAHARNSAEILKGIMEECGIEDRGFIDDVYNLVLRHESGGDPRSDLLKDADGISFFHVNLPLYFERNGWDETERRCIWGYRRLSDMARDIVRGFDYRDEALKRLMSHILER